MKFLRSFLFLIAVFFVNVQPLFAGFGVTPPYVTNVSLTRNSVYEQTIYLVRSDPSTALKATISIDVPGINEWVTIIQGNEFLLPAGEQKIPMTVRVAVPDDADYKQYSGNIRIKTGAPDDKVQGGAVSISLGAQIDVDLTVIDKKIKDFKVRKIGVSDLNEGHKVGWLYFPGKIRFEMLIENIGNVPIAPSDVVFRIYDRSGNVLLEEAHKKGKIETVNPFMTETVYAEIPTKLPSGSYLARFEIKNDDDVKLSGEVNLSVLPYGTLQTAGFGFLGLSIAHKLSIIIPVLFFICAPVLIFLRSRKRRR
jgi:uncharacterized membrane protein